MHAASVNETVHTDKRTKCYRPSLCQMGSECTSTTLYTLLDFSATVFHWGDTDALLKIMIECYNRMLIEMNAERVLHDLV